MSAGSTYERLLGESQSGGLEDAGGGGVPGPPDPERLIARLSDEVGWLEEHLGRTADPAAREALMSGAAQALGEVADRGTDARLGRGDIARLEAVVHSDGTRPVLFVENDFFDVEAPAAAGWAASLSVIQAELRTVCRAVGRVNDPHSLLGYQGTAWAIDDGVVVTNYHVLEVISTHPSRSDGTFGGELKPGVTVDFGAEVGGGPPDRVFPVGRVLGVGRAGAPECAHPTVRGVNFDGLDLAVLELEPVRGRPFPAPVQVARGDDTTTQGALASRGRGVYVVGFPGNAASTTPDVFAELFAGVKGVKRLTPGVLTEGRGEVDKDERSWIISHDASTLGGSSGSLVVDLEAGGRKVLGLHFAGVPDRVNWAHGLEGATPELAAVIPGW
ncbi:trypsin-like serine peptidase [Streptomyces aureus]|uniref:trypsin-like serine peptidase n=1 Tax=Streptomyces aureus TaxID=193461 RepID=UPI0006E3D845|nr:trypsin-like peptidase domain-containing protein [Streptomyces aureus]